MIVACAWCKKEVGSMREISDEEYKSASHGICLVCRAINFPESMLQAINDQNLKSHKEE